MNVTVRLPVSVCVTVAVGMVSVMVEVSVPEYVIVAVGSERVRDCERDTVCVPVLDDVIVVVRDTDGVGIVKVNVPERDIVAVPVGSDIVEDDDAVGSVNDVVPVFERLFE